MFLTYYMQQVKGYSPVTTGLLFLPMVGGILIASTLSSVVLPPRVGPRVLIAVGLLLSAGGTAHLGQLTVTSSYLLAHYAGGQATAIASTHGYTLAFAPTRAVKVAATPHSRLTVMRRPRTMPPP